MIIVLFPRIFVVKKKLLHFVSGLFILFTSRTLISKGAIKNFAVKKEDLNINSLCN